MGSRPLFGGANHVRLYQPLHAGHLVFNCGLPGDRYLFSSSSSNTSYVSELIHGTHQVVDSELECESGVVKLHDVVVLVDTRLPLNRSQVINSLTLVLQSLYLVLLKMVVYWLARHANRPSSEPPRVTRFDNWSFNFSTWAISKN